MGSKEKKRSKKASQSRKKKRDRSRSKKRSFKKLRHHEDSYSESDDDSLSSASSSSYTSDEDVKKRRSRSHGKRRKRRARSRSCSSDSTSDSPRAKKRKRSKRKVNLSRKKKSSKKYLRVASSSSASSDGSGYEKHKGGSKKEEMRRRYDNEGKTKRERKRIRSPSMSSEREREGLRKRKRYWSSSDSSPGKSHPSSDQHVQDDIEIQNRPIRNLKSIIVVAAELDQDTMNKGHENDLDMRDDVRRTDSNIVEKAEHIEEKNSGTKGMAPALGNEDLESILRRKALENLKRFRGGSKMAEISNKMETSVTEVKQVPNPENAAGQENIGGCEWKQSLSSAVEPIQNDSDEYIVLNIDNSSQEADQESCPEQGEILASPSRKTENTSFMNHVETTAGGANSAPCSEDSEVMKQKTSPILDNLNPSPAGDIKSDSGDDIASRQLSFRSTKELKSSLQERLNATLVLSNCTSDKTGDSPNGEVNPKSVKYNNIGSNTVDANVTDNLSSSLPITVSGEQVSSEHKGEAEEGSQFQEKTMSVMRGGELVQVSYKVYIPKKVPAVARRRLHR